MPKFRIPSYRLHKASDQAVVELSGNTIYLGRHGTPESRAEYDRRVAEWAGRGRTSPNTASPDGPSVNEVMLAYVRFADGYYRDGDGQPTREVETMKLALRPLKALYGHTAAADFGPLALEAVRDRMIADGLARRVINQRVGYVRRLFKWASRKQLVPPTVYHGLLCVDGLRRGRCAARETEPVMPVPDAHVDAVLPFLPPTLQAMLGLHRLTGMRSGELVRMRAADIDMAGKNWIYRPAKHKTAYLGKVRVIVLGPQCRALLRPYLSADSNALLFSPRRATEERNEIKRAARRTRVQPSQASRKRLHPKRQPGTCYDTRTYYAALRHGMRAAERAGRLAKVEFGHPHRLRHSAAQRIKRELSVDAARSYLCHTKVDMTEHYAGVDTAMAITVAERLGWARIRGYLIMTIIQDMTSPAAD